MDLLRPVAWLDIMVVDVEHELHLVDALGITVHIVSEVVLRAEAEGIGDRAELLVGAQTMEELLPVVAPVTVCVQADALEISAGRRRWSKDLKDFPI
jgi:hypothetical protein